MHKIPLFVKEYMSGTMWRTLVIANFLTQLLPMLPFLVAVEAAEAADESFDPSSWQPCLRSDPVMDPIYEERDGYYFVWQIPSRPKAILIIGHGGGMTPLSFFDPAAKCQQCYGLPEDRRVALEAIKRGYAVIVVKSIGMGYNVVWPIEESEDVMMVTNIVKQWRREHSLENLPMAAWAHSAGGPLATALTLTLMPIRGLILMNCLGMTEVEELATPSTFPPTFLVRMPIDREGSVFNISIQTPEVMARLRERGIEVLYRDLWPKQISPLFFSERIRCMSDVMSRSIYGAFKAAGWLNENDYLTMNPRAYNWRVVLLEQNALPICTDAGEPCFALDVEQELVDAYAEHSFSSDANDEVFPWLDSKVQNPVRKSETLLSQIEMDCKKSGLPEMTERLPLRIRYCKAHSASLSVV